MSPFADEYRYVSDPYKPIGTLYRTLIGFVLSHSSSE
jgi:hypothetical protein